MGSEQSSEFFGQMTGLRGLADIGVRQTAISGGSVRFRWQQTFTEIASMTAVRTKPLWMVSAGCFLSSMKCAESAYKFGNSAQESETPASQSPEEQVIP